MTLIVMIRNICISGRLLSYNLNNKMLYTISASANIHNIKPIMKAPLLKHRLSLLFYPKRNFFRIFKKPSKEQLKIRDDVPDQYSLIYRNTMDRYILYAQLGTTICAYIMIFLAIMQHDFLNVKTEMVNVERDLLDTQPRHIENEIYVYLTAFIGIVVILQIMISRLPIRIYNLPQQKKYIFVFYGNYPFSQRKLTYKVGEVMPLPDLSENGVSPWSQGKYITNDGKKLILFDQYFRRSADLYIMLGVQRDPDVDEK